MIKKEPRPHQLEAISKGVDYFLSNDRGMMIMACGTGKTLTSLWIAESFSALNIIVALPSLQLQSQTIGTWIDESRLLNYKMLAVGSDKSVEKRYGVKATTDSNEIALFLRDSSPKIVFSTYQSSDTLIKACNETKTIFDFGIIDEAHNTTGSNQKIFAKILYDKNGIIIKKRLYMTATPVFFTNDEAISMDNNEVYGDEFYNLTTRDAISQGILTDYKVLVIWLNDKKIQQYVTSNGVVKFNGVSTRSKYLVLREFLEKATLKYKLKKIISFHNSRKNASEFAQIINQGSVIKSYNIDSNYSVNDRNEIINSFIEDDISCVTNPRIMIEGYDLPMIDSVIFSDIKSSSTEVNQSMGRALRIHPKKEKSYILIPIVIDENGVVNIKEYNKVVNVLSGISISDKKIYNYYDKRVKVSNLIEDESENIEELVIGSVDSQMLKLLKEQLSVRVWKKSTKNQRVFVDLKTFKKEFLTIAEKYGIDNGNKYLDWASGKQDFGIPFPKDFPKAPYSYFNDFSWKDIFVRNRISYEFFKKEFLTIAEKYGIDNGNKYLDWASGKQDFGIPFPKDFPKDPFRYYENFSWKDIFIRNRLSYEFFKKEFLIIAEKYGIDNGNKYFDWASGKHDFGIIFPSHFPKFPHSYFDDFTWKDVFLYKESQVLDYETFKIELLKITNKYGIDSSVKYKKWASGKQDFDIPFPKDFPKDPFKYYEDFSWNDIFLKGNRRFLDYKSFKEELLNIAERYGIDTGVKYEKWARGQQDFGILFPNNFPKKPYSYFDNFSWASIFRVKGERFLDYEIFKNEMLNISEKYGIDTFTKYNDWGSGKQKFGIPFPKKFPKALYSYFDNFSWELLINNEKKEILDYEVFKNEMLTIAEKYSINTGVKYKNWASGKQNFGIPFPNNFSKNPPIYYNNFSWNDIFIKNKLSYEFFKKEFLILAEKYGIDTYVKYRDWAKSKQDFGIPFPKNFPKDPYTYFDSFSWSDTLKKD